MSLKKISLLIGFILCLSLFNIHTTSAKVQFVDVPPSYDAYEEIQYLINLGAIKGYETENGTYYKPHQPVTRGQAAKMVVISSGLQPLKVKQSSFKDVQTGTELSGYVERAVKEGYFSAFKNGEFGPYVNLTRKKWRKF